MKFNYQFEEGNDSDSEFLDDQISTSFTFDRSDKVQLRNLKKWLKYMNINHAVTRLRDESGEKKYCVVIYEGDRSQTTKDTSTVTEPKITVEVKEVEVEEEEVVVEEVVNETNVPKISKSRKRSKKKNTTESLE